ncbi:uncharacterized protein LOC120666820 isoform X2 [Panicum virgatum]|nr:uncharacterized protein LOC120666820 isoform X2 [Panicum virgatum]XP_039802718.1 uncharacterized protein LOC120666820 isoform X2 [Panicum virgatum]XP_039802719.1 uncharacterized protein LOC120666820 isoform X2 [Panicum virgatum]XP_039802720.1 uncharacterized protein LOC120666820 isoform X2 [Panicum virgatum]XP_039802721.1 uncharacterized protein LOC120666820 isoform X2 [Panicum virgatum]XP_039802722.1 uncharacterized protein LOC120666820 isoform X2 [Panicum virgatum]XP_039802723.1 uncharac
MSFRRLVHLVVDDVGLRRTYSLRSIDMSRLFRRPPRESTGGCGRPDQPPPTEEDHEMKPCPLPAPTMTFYPPRCWYHDGEMEFMLLGGRHNKVVAADQTGRAVLYDPDQHAVRTLSGFGAFKSMPASLTVGEDHLYVLGTVPCEDGRYFECLELDSDGDEDWHPRVLPPPPYIYNEHRRGGPPPDSYAAVEGGGPTHILVSKASIGTYSFDTAAEAWSKAGDWTLPFSGRAEYVPEHGLWFGLRNNMCCGPRRRHGMEAPGSAQPLEGLHPAGGVDGLLSVIGNVYMPPQIGRRKRVLLHQVYGCALQPGASSLKSISKHQQLCSSVFVRMFCASATSTLPSYIFMLPSVKHIKKNMLRM